MMKTFLFVLFLSISVNARLREPHARPCLPSKPCSRNPLDVKPGLNLVDSSPLQHRGGENNDDSGLGSRLLDVIQTYWYLGLIGFGGPPAHVAILRDLLVVRKGWMSNDEFTDMFSLTQALPGPSSTQLLIATAASRAGLLGGLIACILWCLPGFLALAAAGRVLYQAGDSTPLLFGGIRAAALALTLRAGYRFAVSLDDLQKGLATVSCLIALLINNDNAIPKTSAHYVYPTLLALGGIVSFTSEKKKKQQVVVSSNRKTERQASTTTKAGLFDLPLWFGVAAFLLCAGIFGLTMLWDNSNPVLKAFQIHYRAGGIIFGGGPVIVPLLASEVVPGWMSNEKFFQGVGLAQSLPGPMFNFVAYLGAIHSGWKGAIASQLGLFAPGFILIFALLPFWVHLRDRFKSVLRGVNGAAIGLIGSACVTIYANSIRTGADAMILAGAGSLVAFSALPAPFIILAGAILGAVLKLTDLGQKSLT